MIPAEYKTCARNGCSNPAEYRLTIIYLNKTGWFCELCKNELIEDGLALEGILENGQ